MVVSKQQVDTNTVRLTITSTGKPGDNVNLPDGLPTVPYTGQYKIDWGDGSAIQVVSQPIDAAGPPVTTSSDPTVVNHDYTQKGAFRGYVEGDARIRFHALSS